MKDLAQSVWLERPIYEEAEIAYYERLQQGGTETLTPLAGEVAKARQRLIESRDTFKEATGGCCNTNIDVDAQKFMEKKVVEFDQTFKQILSKLDSLCLRVEKIEKQFQGAPKTAPQVAPQAAQKAQKEDDDDVDLFGSDDEEEDAAAAKIREERLAAYAAKKSKKPALIAKSNVILDVKPWDDETDMKALEAAVRKIECDGLLWGTSKLVPLAYGIHKLTISCVVEDEKVSIDWLTEQIEANEDYIQSVDIAAFNKI